MKIKVCSLLALVVLPSLALAGFKVPSKVFEVAELDKAKADAVAKKRPIAILFSDKDSTCPLCSGASETIIKELGSKTTMIYTKDLSGLPKPVMEALKEGRYIPKVAVLDSELQTSLGTVTYEAIKADSNKAFKDVEKAIRSYGK